MLKDILYETAYCAFIVLIIAMIAFMSVKEPQKKYRKRLWCLPQYCGWVHYLDDQPIYFERR